LSQDRGANSDPHGQVTRFLGCRINGHLAIHRKAYGLMGLGSFQSGSGGRYVP